MTKSATDDSGRGPGAHNGAHRADRQAYRARACGCRSYRRDSATPARPTFRARRSRSSTSGATRFSSTPSSMATRYAVSFPRRWTSRTITQSTAATIATAYSTIRSTALRIPTSTARLVLSSPSRNARPATAAASRTSSCRERSSSSRAMYYMVRRRSWFIPRARASIFSRSIARSASSFSGRKT